MTLWPHPHALDVATHVPHAAVRAYAMPGRELDDATPDDVTAMARLVEQAVRAGALGFATGRTAGHRDVHGQPVPGTFAARTAGHRDVHGQPVPGTFAARDELQALMDALVRGGGGVFQLTPSGVLGRWSATRAGR